MAQAWLTLPCHGDDMRGPTRQRHILSIRWTLIRKQGTFSHSQSAFYIPVVALFARISSHHQLRCQLDDWMTLLSVLGWYYSLILSLYWLSSAQTVESQFLLLAYFNQSSQRGSIPNLTRLATAWAGSVTLNNGHLCVRGASLFSIQQSLSLNSLSKEIILIKLGSWKVSHTGRFRESEEWRRRSLEFYWEQMPGPRFHIHRFRARNVGGCRDGIGATFHISFEEMSIASIEHLAGYVFGISGSISCWEETRDGASSHRGTDW